MKYVVIVSATLAVLRELRRLPALEDAPRRADQRQIDGEYSQVRGSGRQRCRA
jgi:hypothetical protein